MIRAAHTLKQIRTSPSHQTPRQSLVASILWDMQKDAELEDGEKAMVEELQKAFLVCCCSAGPQDASGTNETPTNQTQRGSTAMR
ncbi:hypothetical protein CHARACLAT_020182 [Characodon lateralis]|uniref:Uncharacterized protein n=1 Tax=Characodon lateralis TaxID=208331 RepID=A0ABU7EM25_9TELE|nr:hypothetical protein [Characodon lateralis]